MHLGAKLAVILIVIVVVGWLYYTARQASFKYERCGYECTLYISGYLGIIFVILAISCLALKFYPGMIMLVILFAIAIAVLGYSLISTQDDLQSDVLRAH